MTPRSIRSRTVPLDARVRVPGSKSVTHRALVAAALARGRSVLRNPLDADDTRVTAAGLAALGIAVDRSGTDWTVEGGGGRVPGGGDLELGQSGTSMRFLAAVAALGDRPSTLDGHPRLRERPMEELYAALRAVGASIEPPEGGTSLPVRIGAGRARGGAVSMAGGRSSQFASALLLIGARLGPGIEVTIRPPAVSLPYVEVTVRVLREFGVPVAVEGLHYRVAKCEYPGRDLVVEGDHSSASCLLAAAAIVGGRVRVDGVRADSAQPDARMVAILDRLGCDVRAGRDHVEVVGRGAVPGFDEDLGEAPDLTPAVAALAAFAEGPCRLTGIAHLRLKESDRLAVLARNLRALGRAADTRDDALVVAGPAGELRGAHIVTEGDHRMAMAFAVVGLRVPGTAIDDPACVAKSFPDFWKEFEALETGAGSGHAPGA